MKTMRGKGKEKNGERDTQFRRRRFQEDKSSRRGKGTEGKVLKVKFLLAEVRYYARYLDASHIGGALFLAAERSERGRGQRRKKKGEACNTI